MKKSLFWLLALVLSPIAVLVIITPMDSQKQYLFGLLSIGILFLMGFSKKRSISVIMVVTSLLMSTRYMYFRLTQTLHFNSTIETVLGMGLFLAEVYIWVMLLLNYLQTVWPLKREIVPLPDDMSTWPTVDIYIPSYNEPLEVVRDTVLAAQCIDYPADKMKIYLLDDGKRSEFAVFAADVGVGYITRNDNKHAKAGNLNHAMTLTHGELICVFDCDHVATRVFLQATVGGFLKDPMLALVQTPHYFYSPDPFERNLSVGRNIPNEGMLFYGPIQQGNDNWNATFFCGSCAVIRRKALDDIGGFAVETVTEDAHTALKFQRLGWKSSFLDIPLAAGLATERLVVHVIQRTRWARGMTQIFRLDNPLLGRGLTFQQRLCYLSAMLYYQFALPRVVFVTAPLAYLLFNLNIIYSSASLIVSYALPHLFLAIYVGSRMNGRYRYSFWGEIYDIVLAFHLVLPTLVTMIFPKRGKFNVTDKGGLLDVGYFDFTVVRPHLVVACLLAVGVIVGIVRAIGHDYFGSDPNVIALNVGWGLYSLIFLLAAIAVARETRQVRKTIRIDVNIPVLIHYASGIVSRSHTADLSMGGCRIAVPDDRHLQDEIEEIELILQSGAICIPAEQVTADEDFIRLKFDENIPLSLRRELVRVVLARADAWINPPRPQDNPFRSFFTILRCVFELFWLSWKTRRGRRQQKPVASSAQEGWATMKRLTTLALLAGMFSIPVLHGEEAPADRSAPLNFPLPGATTGGIPADESASTTGADPSATPEVPVIPEPSAASGSSTASTPTTAEPAAADPATSLPVMPPPTNTAMPDVAPLTAVVGGSLNLAQMGMPDGIILSGGQQQGGAGFTLPSDQVVTHAELMLDVQVSPDMAARNATLQLMLNGQPLGTVPLGTDGADISHYQLDIPAALMVSSNNLSFKVNDGDNMQCQLNTHDTSGRHDFTGFAF